jgi:hypothetical protein
MTMQSSQGLLMCIPTFYASLFPYKNDGKHDKIWMCEWELKEWLEHQNSNGGRFGWTVYSKGDWYQN